jgi:hypothetical protein
MDEQKASTWRWGRRLFVPAALTLSLTLGLAACGGSSPKDAVATLGDDNNTDDVSNSDATNSDTEITEEERQQAMLDFARCMREHGVDMPDPTFDENGGSTMAIGVEGENMPDQATMEAAQEACEPIMEDVIAAGPQDMDPEEVAKRQEEALAFAKCMRDHGVDFPDPQFEGGGRMTQSMTADPSDPNFQAAQEACATEFSGGGGPGFSVGGPAVGSSSDGKTTNSDGGDE